jgi:methylase of polypeptide subunit release factors
MAFGPLQIRFDERVLRPRPWTLEQARWAAELSDGVPDGAVAELCAGVGHIGLALAAAVPRELVLVDTDLRACELARANAEAAGLTDRVDVRTGEVDATLRPEERFALMLADPPWVRSDGTDEFPDDPVGAIDGGDDGLDLARTCLRVISQHLGQGGVAILQLGDGMQSRAVADHLDRHPELGLRVADVRNPDANGVLVLLLGRDSA